MSPTNTDVNDYNSVKKRVLKKTAKELVKHYKLNKKDAENVAIH